MKNAINENEPVNIKSVTLDIKDIAALLSGKPLYYHLAIGTTLQICFEYKEENNGENK